jgi:hypothetical protein
VLAPLTAACLLAAAHAYRIPPSYLDAILAVEGGRIGEAVADRNGTRDLGPFQINSSWGPAVAHFWGMPAREALDRVRDDGCANAIVAAAILRQCTNEARGDLTVALGLYHSHRSDLAQRYREKALMALLPIEKRAEH